MCSCLTTRLTPSVRWGLRRQCDGTETGRRDTCKPWEKVGGGEGWCKNQDEVRAGCRVRAGCWKNHQESQVLRQSQMLEAKAEGSPRDPRTLGTKQQRCLAKDTGYGYGRYSQPTGQHRTPAADPGEKGMTMHCLVLLLNPGRDLRSGHRDGWCWNQRGHQCGGRSLHGNKRQESLSEDFNQLKSLF